MKSIWTLRLGDEGLLSLMNDELDAKKFQPLEQYAYPPTPANETIRQYAGQIWRTLRRETEDPYITGDSLRVANKNKLSRIVPPPACGPLLADVNLTLEDWTQQSDPVHWIQLLVLPPCDHIDIVRSWAIQHGHTILESPSRSEIIDGAEDIALPDPSGDGVVVIPRLEYWFIRHRSGLRLLRRLLDRLATLQRHCVIGCNSWAWSFFEKKVGADLVLPHGVTLQAFDAARLHHWFSQLIKSGYVDGKVFRLSVDGSDIFKTDRDDGKPESEYLMKLAARSLGIPWVAWHLWHSSLRFGPKDDERFAKRFPDEQALWVAELDDLQLPKNHVSEALLALHALLLHNALTADELSIVLPSADESNLLAALVSSDFVQRDGDLYSCVPAAYPAIRQSLVSAGFPSDRL